ncbi:MAG: DNA mismatch repair protein MutS [Patescibacteria group bacterium]|nr:DNA mismatch repair protein MutS [Patescibacteria group bacterium]
MDKKGQLDKFTTPMMKQYASIKKKYKDCLLFFRLGDFYELFLDDAQIGAQVLDIALTSRPKGKDGRIPMAGVPYHAVDAYLAKLIKAGYKVAICEQVSEPNKYGIVERDVVRIVTPGTLFDEKSLDRKQNNYLISIDYDNLYYSISIADISTGYLATCQNTYTEINQELIDQLIKIQPSECILPERLYNNPNLLKTLKAIRNLAIYPYNDWERYANKETLLAQFAVKTLDGFGIENLILSQKTCGALIGYLQNTQKGKLKHIKKIKVLESEEYVSLDKSTIINLELFSTIRERETSGTLLSTIDKTNTAMGGRMLKNWLANPLRKRQQILERLDGVEELIKNHKERESIRNLLTEIPDIERILSRLSVGIGNARDLITLKNALAKIIKIKHLLVKIDTKIIQDIQKEISTKITFLVKYIDDYILPDPPFSVKEGGIIRENVDEKIDMLRRLINGGQEWLASLEKKEKERTKISSLKVRYNKVFGYYIEVSKSNIKNVPQNYIRKQTLVNGERFITPELKEWESKILVAEEELKQKEYEIYNEVLQNVIKQSLLIQKAANAIATLDCLVGFADLSERQNYVKPQLLYSGEIVIKEGRHPVVENSLPQKAFIPNSITMDNIKQPLIIITGPNMAGKSVFIRQIAIIVLLAHIGCFVPASKARVSIVDKIFVRSGASDMIADGLSTFMVEMVETAFILNNATSQSLIVMDEIGRGTSTYDGISIAQSIAEYLIKNFTPTPKTLFATHYHELQKLEEIYPNKVSNYHMEVIENENLPIFLYKLKPGGASHSFGIAVAKLAGVPESVIINAQKNLESLEKNKQEDKKEKDQINLKSEKSTNKEIINLIRNININQLTPIKALNFLAQIKEKYAKD